MPTSSAPLLRPCLPPRVVHVVLQAAGSQGLSHENLARVHPMDTIAVHNARETSPRRPRQPPVQTTAPPSRSPPLIPIIRLDQKREGPPHRNEYVDTPSRSTTVNNGVSTTPSNSHTQQQQTAIISSQPAPSSSPLTSSSSSFTTQEEPSILEQQPAGLKKDAGHDKDDAIGSSGTKREIHTDSIICSKCGKCKCKACTHPEPSARDCTPSKVVECFSCLYCVQCMFYHCFKDNESTDDMCSADDPCACCERPYCLKRWTCMGFMSLCLPCLCCYWPLKGVISSCTALRNRCSRRGCHCRKDKVPSINKRLIPESESSST